MELTPLEGKWLHGGMIKFLENFIKGEVLGDPHVKETDGFCASLPLVAKFAGRNEYFANLQSQFMYQL